MAGKIFNGRKRNILTIERNAKILRQELFRVRQPDLDGLKGLRARRQYLEVGFNFEMRPGLRNKVNEEALLLDGVAGPERNSA